jgi:hypothetical protein
MVAVIMSAADRNADPRGTGVDGPDRPDDASAMPSTAAAATSTTTEIREFIYLDVDRVRPLAAQVGVASDPPAAGPTDRAERERLYLATETALLGRLSLARLDPSFDFGRWSQTLFADGQFVLSTGTVRLLDFQWLAMALGGLPAVLRKMSKIELAAFRNSEEGRRMSKSALQQKSTENQAAIAKVEEFKMDELSGVVTQLYGDVVRVKVRPSKDHPRCVLVGSAYARHFYDSAAVLNQKYGVQIDAAWTILGQVNVPNPDAAPPQPMPTGNQMEDAFEQIAMLMNNAFRVATAPAFPGFSFTPIAMYRTVR